MIIIIIVIIIIIIIIIIVIIIIIIHVHSVDRVDIEAQFVSKLGSSLGSGWLQQVITASNGLSYSLFSKNIGNEET